MDRRAWISGVVGGFIGAAIGAAAAGCSKTSATSQAATKSSMTTIRVSIGTAGTPEPKETSLWSSISLADLWNDGFRDLAAAVDRKTGLIAITFGFEVDEEWMGWPGADRVGAQRLLVRCFDANGKYISHFETEERYYPADAPEAWLKAMRERISHRRERYPDKAEDDPIPIQEDGNILEYRQNLRDAAFINAIEVGWLPIADSGRPFIARQERNGKGMITVSTP